MAATEFRCRALRAAAIGVLGCQLAGCTALDENAWTLGFTRSAWSDVEHGYFGAISEGLADSRRGASGAEFVAGGLAVALAAVPLVFDVVALPVTLTRDLWVAGG